MRLRGLTCVSIFGACVFTSSAESQADPSGLRIKLEATDAASVSGALIALLDSRDSVVAEALGREDGTRTLRAAPGTYRVRVRRIGYLPFVSDPVTLTGTTELVLTIESPRVVLQSIVVNSKSQCRRNDPNTQALSAVWDEIDKALRSSQLTIQDLSGIGHGLSFRRVVNNDGTIISADTNFFSITTQRPFGAIHPDTLASKGYVIGDEMIGWLFFAPDETVLLSEQFAATHCFHLVRQSHRVGQIGVALEPVPSRKLADISGVLWVDERTSELREVVFRYVNAGLMSQFDGGGYTRFRRLASGAWIVDKWLLSAPRIEGRRTVGSPTRFVRVGREETGGAILAPSEVAVDLRARARVDTDSSSKKR
ncbi:MAG: carboxypeptidase-like regulatory domain-containing protein [Gemmatimonadaceae bacterium]